MMKQQTPIVVAAVVAAGLVLGIYLTAPLAEAPERKFNAAVNEKLEAARRILYAYDAGESFADEVDARVASYDPSLQMTDENISTWEENWGNYRGGSAEPGKVNLFREGLNRQASQLQELRREYDAVSGEPGQEPQSAMSAASAVGAIRKRRQANAARLETALELIEQAMGESAERSDGTRLSGSRHLEANWLKALVLSRMAVLDARRALGLRMTASDEWARFTRAYDEWREVTDVMASLRRDISTTQPATRKVEPIVAERKPAEAKAAEGRPEAEGQPIGKKRGPLSRVFGRIRGAVSNLRQRATQAPAPGEAEPAEQPPGDVAAEEPATQPAGPSPIVAEQLPTIRQRIAQLIGKRKGVASEVAEQQARIEELKRIVTELRAKIGAERRRARDAEKRAFDVEDAGFDSSRPEALEAFNRAYSAAAAEHRAAAAMAQLLESGGLRNIKPFDDDQEWLSGSLAPEEGKRLEPVRGLRAYERDLAQAELLRATLAEGPDAESPGLTRVISGKIGDLEGEEKSVRERINAMQERAADAKQRAQEFLAKAEAANQEAEKIEAEALRRLDEGVKAADQALSAAQERARRAREKQPVGGEPNPRLTMMSQQDGWIGGQMDALAGDLHVLRAQVLRQQERALRVRALAMWAATDVGLEGALSANELMGQATAKLDEAITAASEALERYNQGDRPLRDLWTLHADIAAVEYMLAHMAAGQDRQEHLDRAMDEYRRAVQGRETRAEARAHLPILQQLELQR